jgi:esterase/lipase superfamily enzyme
MTQYITAGAAAGVSFGEWLTWDILKSCAELNFGTSSQSVHVRQTIGGGADEKQQFHCSASTQKVHYRKMGTECMCAAESVNIKIADNVIVFISGFLSFIAAAAAIARESKN